MGGGNLVRKHLLKILFIPTHFSQYYHYAFDECQSFTTQDQLGFHRSSNRICAANNMALCVSADFCDQIAHKPVQSGPEPVEPDTDVTDDPSEPKPIELKPIESKPVESKPVELKPVELKPVEPKPVEFRPVEPKPGEFRPIELKFEPQDFEEPTIQFKMLPVEDEPVWEVS